MTIDLHLHTHHSDGSWSPTELVEYGVKLKMRCLAVTDHDTTAGIEEATLAGQGRLEIIPGVEINTIWNDADGKHRDVHILGYFIDTHNQVLKDLLEKQREARITQVKEAVEKISKTGLPITFDLVKKNAGIGSIGKSHLMQAIVDAGGAKEITEAYEKFIASSSPHYCPRRSVTPEEAIQAINEAGGIASIAHPGKDASIKEKILHLKKHGLRAIEVFHRSHDIKILRNYIRFANSNQLLITGGSDCHGPYKQFNSTMGSIVLPPEHLATLRAASGN